jgi:hypothetical protein
LRFQAERKKQEEEAKRREKQEEDAERERREEKAWKEVSDPEILVLVLLKVTPFLFLFFFMTWNKRARVRRLGDYLSRSRSLCMSCMSTTSSHKSHFLFFIEALSLKSFEETQVAYRVCVSSYAHTKDPRHDLQHFYNQKWFERIETQTSIFKHTHIRRSKNENVNMKWQLRPGMIRQIVLDHRPRGTRRHPFTTLSVQHTCTCILLRMLRPMRVPMRLRMHASVRAERHKYIHKGGGNMHVRVKCAVGLPKMDISTGACDPYVKVVLDGKEHKVSCKAEGEERES